MSILRNFTCRKILKCENSQRSDGKIFNSLTIQYYTIHLHAINSGDVRVTCDWAIWCCISVLHFHLWVNNVQCSLLQFQLSKWDKNNCFILNPLIIKVLRFISLIRKKFNLTHHCLSTFFFKFKTWWHFPEFKTRNSSWPL